MENLLMTESQLTLLKNHVQYIQAYVAQLPYLLQMWEQGLWQQAVMIEKRMQRQSRGFIASAQRILQAPDHALYPFTQQDVYQFLQEFDQIKVEGEKVAKLILEKKMQCPKDLLHHYEGYIYACLALLNTVADMFAELDMVILSSSFDQRQFFKKMWLVLEQLKDDIVQIHHELQQDLIAGEAELSLTDAVFLHQLFERTHQIATKTQQVGKLCLQSI